MELKREIKICHLGGPGHFEYVVTSRPSGEWLIRVRGERPTQASEVTDEELVEYANCRGEIEAVQRYINKYGPPFVTEPDCEGFFYGETLGRWSMQQIHFREIWDRFLGIEVRNRFTEALGKGFPELWAAQEPWTKVQAEGEFQIASGKLIFLATTHYMALVIKLLAVSATEKLRRCLNPCCSNTPYFIADHGKAQYCSEECGAWGQRKAKLKYWHERRARPTGSKSDIRTKGQLPDKNKRGGGKNVTHKTR